jgi:hypothetical protein
MEWRGRTTGECAQNRDWIGRDADVFHQSGSIDTQQTEAQRAGVGQSGRPDLERRRLLQIGAAGLAAAFTASGCLPPASLATTTPNVATGAVAVNGERASPTEDAAISGIQEVLDRQARAGASANYDAFAATIDQRNLTWRRIQREVFEAEISRGARSASKYAVTRVQPKQDGYFKAWIDITPPGARSVQEQAVWVFRWTEQGWLHSEILNEEIGRRKLRETEHFQLAYFDWDDDVIDRMAAVAERAYARTVERTGIALEGRIAVSVNPTYGAHAGLRGYGTWAIYIPRSEVIVIRSIESYGAGTTALGESQDDRLLVALTHEYAHLVNDRLVPTVKMPKWMVEGFAEYVAGNLRSAALLPVLRNGKQFSLDKASDIIEWGLDPARNYTSADISLAYAHAAHGVSYFMERFGQDQFFSLANHYADSRRWEESFLQVIGTSWAQFERDWVEWARKRYGV